MNILETYRLGNPPGLAQRAWIYPSLMVGGGIRDAADAEHLARDYGIATIISVESEGVGDLPIIGERWASCYSRFPFQDLKAVGMPDDVIAKVVTFARLRCVGTGALPAYVHCHLGRSRGPATAYLILRAVVGQGQAEAMRTMTAALGPHGNPCWTSHSTFLEGIERWIARKGIRP
jgi:hypothetical protein